MLTIEKYLSLNWVRYFIAIFVLLLVIALFGDIVNTILRNKYSIGEGIQDFILESPFFISKILPVACMLATLFSLHTLKTHSELIAILASGYSVKRFYILITILATLVGFFQFNSLAFLAPALTKIKYQKENNTSDNVTSFGGDQIWIKNKNYFGSYQLFIKESDTMKFPRVYFYDKNHQLTKIVKAEEAIFQKDSWKFKDVIVYNNLNQEGFPSQVTLASYNVPLYEKPDDLRKFQSNLLTLNFLSLFNFVRKLRGTGINLNEYYILLLEKFSLSMACIIFAIFPLIELKSPNKRTQSIGKAIFSTILFTLFFWGTYSFFLSLGSDGQMPALIATFTVPAIIGLYIFMVYRNQNRL